MRGLVVTAAVNETSIAKKLKIVCRDLLAMLATAAFLITLAAAQNPFCPGPGRYPECPQCNVYPYYCSCTHLGTNT